MSEFDRWETRYSAPGYAFGREPNYFLATCKHLLPKSGRALADGEGRNGVWLAQQSLDVVSLDFSPASQVNSSRPASRPASYAPRRVRAFPYLPTDGDLLHYAVEDYPVRLIALDSVSASERKGVYCAQRLAWL